MENQTLKIKKGLQPVTDSQQWQVGVVGCLEWRDWQRNQFLHQIKNFDFLPDLAYPDKITWFSETWTYMTSYQTTWTYNFINDNDLSCTVVMVQVKTSQHLNNPLCSSYNPDHLDWNAMCERATLTLLSNLTSQKTVWRCKNVKRHHNLHTHWS